MDISRETVKISGNIQLGPYIEIGYGTEVATPPAPEEGLPTPPPYPAARIIIDMITNLAAEVKEIREVVDRIEDRLNEPRPPSLIRRILSRIRRFFNVRAH